MKAVEKGSGVHTGRLFPLSSAGRGREVSYVAPQNIRVEPEILAAEDHLLIPEVLSQGIDRLAQPPAPPLLVRVRPEERQQLFAGEPPVAGACQHGEQRKPARLGRGTGQRLALSRDGEPTEGLEIQQVAPGDNEVTRT